MAKQAITRFNDGIPQDSFLFRYLDWMSVQETALPYDVWCALWVMSNAVGRRTVIDRPRAPVYMNLYCMLLAESGITRKTTAVVEAKKLLQTWRGSYDIAIVTSKQTPEGLDQILHEQTIKHQHAHLAISVNELVTFLGRTSSSLALPGMLTDLYDCERFRTPGTSTVIRGSLDTYTTFLSASTPSWLAGAVNPDVVEGGFTSRCIFVHAERRKAKYAVPQQHAREANLYDELLADLDTFRSLSEKRDKLPLNQHALDEFTRWYNARPDSRDPYESSFESREDAHVLRIAGFLAINDGTWLIGSIHIRKAVRLVAMAKHWGSAIFSGRGLHSRTMDGIQKLRSVLLEAGLNPVTRSQVTHRLSRVCSGTEIGAILDVLHNLDMIQVFEVPVIVGSKRTKLVYRATQLLTDRGLMEQALDELDQAG